MAGLGVVKGVVNVHVVTALVGIVTCLVVTGMAGADSGLVSIGAGVVGSVVVEMVRRIGGVGIHVDGIGWLTANVHVGFVLLLDVFLRLRAAGSSSSSELVYLVGDL